MKKEFLDIKKITKEYLARFNSNRSDFIALCREFFLFPDEVKKSIKRAQVGFPWKDVLALGEGKLHPVLFNCTEKNAILIKRLPIELQKEIVEKPIEVYEKESAVENDKRILPWNCLSKRQFKQVVDLNKEKIRPIAEQRTWAQEHPAKSKSSVSQIKVVEKEIIEYHSQTGTVRVVFFGNPIELIGKLTNLIQQQKTA